ncbi:hypothetical protein V1506DRAFT_533397 [Lipomyces tetrasporus]
MDKIRETRGDPLREILRVVNEMRQEQTEMIQEQTEILNRLDHFTRTQNISAIAPLKQVNRDRDGVQLTFSDGSMPTQHPHNLPPLFTVGAINSLRDHCLINTVKVITFLRLVS